MRIAAKKAFVNKYRGNPTQTCDPVSNFVNFAQRYFRCCGVDDGNDFEKAYNTGTMQGWQGTYVVANEMEELRHFPLSCCRLAKIYDSNSTRPQQSRPRSHIGWLISLCRQMDSQYAFELQTEQTIEANDRTTYMRNGCWPVVKDFFTEPSRIGMICLGVFCLFLLFAATLSFLQTQLC